MVEGLPKAFAGYRQEPVELGRSGAQVFRLNAVGKPTLFLKKSEGVYSANLRGAAARLEWLSGKLPVPEVVHFHEDAPEAWLVMTPVPGVDLTSFNGESRALKQRLTVELAHALRHFHKLDARGCPFNHSAAQELSRLEAKISSHENALRHPLREAREELERLRAAIPEETLVLTHGDACLPNIMVSDGKLSGFIDLGAMGLGDRCRDLERACWSLGYNYGDGYDEVFLEAYGATEDDQVKLDFYQALEWFSVGEGDA